MTWNSWRSNPTDNSRICCARWFVDSRMSFKTMMSWTLMYEVVMSVDVAKNGGMTLIYFSLRTAFIERYEVIWHHSVLYIRIRCVIISQYLKFTHLQMESSCVLLHSRQRRFVFSSTFVSRYICLHNRYTIFVYLCAWRPFFSSRLICPWSFYHLFFIRFHFFVVVPRNLKRLAFARYVMCWLVRWSNHYAFYRIFSRRFEIARDLFSVFKNER